LPKLEPPIKESKPPFVPTQSASQTINQNLLPQLQPQPQSSVPSDPYASMVIPREIISLTQHDLEHIENMHGCWISNTNKCLTFRTLANFMRFTTRHGHSGEFKFIGFHAGSDFADVQKTIQRTQGHHHVMVIHCWMPFDRLTVKLFKCVKPSDWVVEKNPGPSLYEIYELVSSRHAKFCDTIVGPLRRHYWYRVLSMVCLVVLTMLSIVESVYHGHVVAFSIVATIFVVIPSGSAWLKCWSVNISDFYAYLFALFLYERIKNWIIVVCVLVSVVSSIYFNDFFMLPLVCCCATMPLVVEKLCPIYPMIHLVRDFVTETIKIVECLPRQQASPAWVGIIISFLTKALSSLYGFWKHEVEFTYAFTTRASELPTKTWKIVNDNMVVRWNSVTNVPPRVIWMCPRTLFESKVVGESDITALQGCTYFILWTADGTLRYYLRSGAHGYLNDHENCCGKKFYCRRESLCDGLSGKGTPVVTDISYICWNNAKKHARMYAGKYWCITSDCVVTWTPASKDNTVTYISVSFLKEGHWVNKGFKCVAMGELKFGLLDSVQTELRWFFNVLLKSNCTMHPIESEVNINSCESLIFQTITNSQSSTGDDHLLWTVIYETDWTYVAASILRVQEKTDQILRAIEFYGHSRFQRLILRKNVLEAGLGNVLAVSFMNFERFKTWPSLDFLTAVCYCEVPSATWNLTGVLIWHHRFNALMRILSGEALYNEYEFKDPHFCLVERKYLFGSDYKCDCDKNATLVAPKNNRPDPIEIQIVKGDDLRDYSHDIVEESSDEEEEGVDNINIIKPSVNIIVEEEEVSRGIEQANRNDVVGVELKLFYSSLCFLGSVSLGALTWWFWRAIPHWLPRPYVSSAWKWMKPVEKKAIRNYFIGSFLRGAVCTATGLGSAGCFIEGTRMFIKGVIDTRKLATEKPDPQNKPRQIAIKGSKKPVEEGKSNYKKGHSSGHQQRGGGKFEAANRAAEELERWEEDMALDTALATDYEKDDEYDSNNFVTAGLEVGGTNYRAKIDMSSGEEKILSAYVLEKGKDGPVYKRISPEEFAAIRQKEGDAKLSIVTGDYDVTTDASPVLLPEKFAKSAYVKDFLAPLFKGQEHKYAKVYGIVTPVYDLDDEDERQLFIVRLIGPPAMTENRMRFAATLREMEHYNIFEIKDVLTQSEASFRKDALEAHPDWNDNPYPKEESEFNGHGQRAVSKVFFKDGATKGLFHGNGVAGLNLKVKNINKNRAGKKPTRLIVKPIQEGLLFNQKVSYAVPKNLKQKMVDKQKNLKGGAITSPNRFATLAKRVL
jgi:hypothetical protein